MSSPQEAPLRFYVTPPHVCGYLPERESVSLFADPAISKSTALLSALTAHGFRRSGKHIYRPHCGACHACIAVRIPVADFSLQRHQRRTWEQNQDLSLHFAPTQFNHEHFSLYQRYIRARHTGSDMDNSSPEHFLDFLTAPWAETLFVEYRLHTTLLAVSVTDVLADGLSAVYTFFDPAEARRSLGKYAVLSQIDLARGRGLPYVYLGYYIADCQKMRYKHDYQPLEYYRREQWSRVPPAGG